MGSVGRVVGKLFLPLQFFLGIWETVTGFFTGFQETQGDLLDKIIGGLEGGVGGLVNFLIAEPLNLLKSAISWIAGKLGFSEVEALLDQFDFMKDVFQPILDGFFGIIKDVKKFFEGLLTFDVAMMGDAAGSLTDTILDIVGAPFNLIMDAVGWIAKQFGFENIGTMFEELDFGSIVKDILAMPYNALKGVGSKIGELFGFGDDEEEELKKEQETAMSNRRKEANLRKQKLRERLKKDQESLKAVEDIDKDLRDANYERLMALKYGDEEGYQDARLRQKSLLEERRAIRGAEIDVRSRENASNLAKPNVTVSAPSAQVDNSTTSSVNSTTVAPPSPRRGRTEQYQDFRDPLWVG